MKSFLIGIACLTVAGAPAAQDYPKLKSGQWELTVTSTRGTDTKANKSTMCVDDAIQRDMMAMGSGMSKEMCTRNEMKRDGNRYIGSAECKIGESRITSRSVMTVNGDSSYHTEISATYDPPFMGMKESSTVLDGKLTGPCRDGMVPGDFVGPNGQKFNIRSLAAANKGAGAPAPAPAPQAAPSTSVQPAPRSKAPQ
ncbi:MAG: DUF3617 family protein [Burkholderiales bacterium]